MRLDRLGLAALGVVLPVLAGLDACGTAQNPSFAGGSGSSSGSGADSDGGDDGSLASSGTDPVCQVPPCFTPFPDGGPQPSADGGVPPAVGTFVAGDCAGCKFPDTHAPSCASSAPAIQVRYPIDGVLLPPNMATISVQWTPFGGYSTYEVDFANSATDVRIITKCSAQTIDTSQP